MRQPDAAGFEVVADLFVLHPIKTVLFEQLRQALPGAGLGFELRQQMIKQGLHHAAQLRLGAARGAEPV